MSVRLGFSRDYSGFDEEKNKEKVPLDLSSILNKRVLVIILFLGFALCLPVLLYLDVFDESKLPPKVLGVCLLDNSYRISCGQVNISEAHCRKILCCFEKKTNSCYHQEPSSYFYYQNGKDSGQFVPSLDYTPLGLPSVKEVKMGFFEDNESLRVYLNDTRVLSQTKINSFKNFDILSNENKKLSVTVYRKNTTEMLLTTLKGPLIVNQDYLEWTIQLTNNSGVLFGLGQLKIDSSENSTVTKIIYKNQNDHNTLPMFMAYNNGKYHAALIRHQGVLQVTVLPSYLIHLKALYTANVEIQLIDGPNPKDIYEKIKKQQEKSIPFKQWMFGLHICREEPVESMDALINQYKSFIENNKNYTDFSYVSECIHDDLLLHMLAENYTSENTTVLFNNLTELNHFMLSFPPQIPLQSRIFENFKHSTVFYKNTTDGNLLVGKYKNFDVVYPIYTQGNADELLDEIIELFQEVNELTGLTFTNSWPQNDDYQMKYTKELFIDDSIKNELSYTIPWNMPDGKDVHARYHNEYGPILSKTLEKKMATKLKLSFSPVSDYDFNKPLITQNLNTSWTQLKKSLEMIIFNSLFARDFLAVPICGSNSFDQNLQEDLCIRWYLVAATMPVIRVSSRGSQRSPPNFSSGYVRNKTINILNDRSSLIPYYRYILQDKSPMVRPMFFNFPDDVNVHGLVEQYMIGDGILVAQPMSSDIEIMQIYLPPSKVWYEIWGGVRYQTEKKKEWISFPIVKSDWVSFVMEGHIIPIVKVNTKGDPELKLIIALKCVSDSCTAEGSCLSEELGDEIIKFEYKGKNLTVTPQTVKKKPVTDYIETICIYNSTSSKCNPFKDLNTK